MSSINEVSSSNKVKLNTENKNNQLKDRKKELVREVKDEVQKKREYTKAELEHAVKETNRIVFEDSSKFEFKVHEGTGRYLIKLVDKSTNETIREIPPEKILDLIANIWEMVGILVDERG